MRYDDAFDFDDHVKEKYAPSTAKQALTMPLAELLKLKP